ncbi:AbrB/MazE/SpoVT family DNA-binding domain-containing protein [Blastomonas sp. SL216]|uniref:AbrB/MazE/SpoVT family DNA-binding domain-containing protein n=1 Tax=Blastomonas sp. SL216 TaxID=2995169 RepID=UPI002377A065|nr:type II toxin-antitoxin system PrlF family antitoxin [Blastomonas sp. SL216]
MALTVLPVFGNTFAMTYQSNMTSKGQVTVPKDIRDALGLEPGQAVAFEIDADGNARIMRANGPDQVEAKKAEFLNRLKEVRLRFKAMDTMSDMDGLAYQRWLRGNEFDDDGQSA